MPLSIRKAGGKILFVALWLVCIICIGLLRSLTTGSAAFDAIGPAISFGFIIIGARIFRGLDEPVDAPANGGG